MANISLKGLKYRGLRREVNKAASINEQANILYIAVYPIIKYLNRYALNDRYSISYRGKYISIDYEDEFIKKVVIDNKIVYSYGKIKDNRAMITVFKAVVNEYEVTFNKTVDFSKESNIYSNIK